MRRFLLALLFSALAIASTTVGYWTQQRDLPVQSKVIEVVGPTYPGGRLLVRWQVYREDSCAATKQEIIIDAGNVRWVLKAIYFPQPPGGPGFDNFISQTELPSDIPLGDATLRVSIAFVCNPVHLLWPVVNRIPDIPFTVIPRPKES